MSSSRREGRGSFMMIVEDEEEGQGEVDVRRRTIREEAPIGPRGTSSFRRSRLLGYIGYTRDDASEMSDE